MISLNSTTCGVKSQRLLKIGTAAKMLGWSRRQMQWACDTDAKLKDAVVRSSGGHRLLPEAALESFLSNGEVSPEPSCSTHAVAIHRVSSDAQKEHLKSQQRITQEWIETHISKDTEVIEYTSVRSSVNFTHDGFTQMLQDFAEGKHAGATVVVTTPCRLGRIGTQIIQFIIEQIGGAKLVYVDPSLKDEDEDDLADDIRSICDFMVHINAKRVGARTAARYRREMSADQLRRCWEMKCRGYSIATIATAMKGEETPNGAVTKKTIERNLKRHTTTLMKLYPPSSIKSDFQTWVEATLAPSATGWIPYKQLMEKWQLYCKRNNVNGSYNGNKLVGMLRKSGFEVKVRGANNRSHVGARWVCFAEV